MKQKMYFEGNTEEYALFEKASKAIKANCVGKEALAYTLVLLENKISV
jgi:hypothetical protein